MTKNIPSQDVCYTGKPVYQPGTLSAVYAQAMYKIKAKGNTLKRIEPLLRWDAMDYDMSALYKEPHYNHNKLSFELLLYFL